MTLKTEIIAAKLYCVVLYYMYSMLHYIILYYILSVLDFELSIFVTISGYLTVVRIVVILLDVIYIPGYPEWATLQ